MRIPIEDLRPKEPILFTYKKSDLMQAVEMKTSYIGKMRADKDKEHYIERMSLTEGESFLSDDMLLDAIAHVHEWLGAFTRSIKQPYGIDYDPENGDNVFFVVQPKDWWSRNEYSTVEMHIKNALVEYIIWQWFEIVNPAESEAHYAKYEDYAHSAQLGMNKENGNLERRFNTPFNTIYERREPWQKKDLRKD